MSCPTCKDHGVVTPQARTLPCPDCQTCQSCRGSGKKWPSTGHLADHEAIHLAESEAGMLSTVCPGCGGSGREKR